MTPGYPVPQQMNPGANPAKDESDLRTLSILHYVWSALLGCSAIGVVGYFAMIGGIVANAPSAGDPQGAQVAAGMMIVMGVVTFVLMIPLFILHLMAAAGLKKKTRYMLIMIMSGFACLSMPLGTALGIWTIITLSRPGVKQLFGRV
jgi:hypothetical protein